MNKIILLAALLLSAVYGFAQNKAIIKGKVVDSTNNQPVELATVAILDARDTTATLISYTLTDKTGMFTLHNVPAGIPIKVLISFVSYQPFRKIFTLGKTETMDMGIIRVSPKLLREVTIKGERMPISVRKDTIEFLAEAFKVRPNAVVEDLLKKLPGVEVDNQGKITAMGKEVTKILVDGREFFPSDARIASKNLDADLIDKVQVYDDREDDPDHLIPDVQVKKIINLKFKRALKKSIFGKVYGGEGTQDHYQTGGLFNMFRDTLQVSVLGLRNNLNSTGFDFNDLYTQGGLNRGGDAISRGGGFGGFGLNGGAQGKQTATTAGININTDYGKKLKINLAYLYKSTQTEFNTLTNRQQFLNDTTATTNSLSDRLNNAHVHSISATVVWRPDDATQLRYTPLVNITQNGSSNTYSSNSFSNFINPINNSVTGSSSTGSNFQFQHSLSYNRQLKKKGSSINVDQNLQFNPTSGFNFDNQSLTSYISSFPSYVLRQEGDNNNKNTEAGVTVTYRTPVSKKLSFDIGVNEDYSDHLDKVSTYDYNPVTGQYDSFLIMKSSDLTRRNWSQSVTPGITYNFPKGINLMAHLAARYQEVDNVFNRNTADIDQNFFTLLPNVSLNMKGFSIGYNRSMDLPNIGDMIPYSVVVSPLYTVTGNPDLKPTTRDNFTIGYNKFDYQKGNTIFLNANASFTQNSIFRERTLDAALVETSTPINRSGRYNYGLSGTFSKRLKKTKDFQFNAISSVSFYSNHDFYVLNHQDGYQNNYNASISERFSLNWKDIVELDPQYTLTDTHTTYSGVNSNTQDYLRHNLDTHFNIFFVQHMNVEGNYTYMYNPQVAPGFQKNSNLLSLSLARQFLKKDRAEIKLSCYDILNQNVSLSRNINENSITDTQTQVIKRYFMITLQFKFNKSTLKGDEKPAASPLGAVKRMFGN